MQGRLFGIPIQNANGIVNRRLIALFAVDLKILKPNEMGQEALEEGA
jgi:hypothetical protein